MRKRYFHLLAVLCWAWFGSICNITGVESILISTSRCALRQAFNNGLRSMHRGPLFAKKRLISDDLFASFDEPSDTSAVSQQATTVSSGAKGKKPAQNQKLISDTLLTSLIEDAEDTVVEHIGKGKVGKVGSNQATGSIANAIQPNSHDNQKHKQKELNAVVGTSSDRDSVDIPVPVDVHKGNKPQKDRTRKDKPSSRVRFTESAQPSFVSIGLDKVSLLFGNEVVLKDATFSVNTGERVGLVGPNGGGKSTMLKVLAGEIEPTTGDILKSSSTLRIAYLKQEFTETIVMTRTLKEELLASFVEEHRILAAIEQCEADLARTTDSPDAMDEVLTKLQDLQDLAVDKQCYSLEPRVLKVMDSMGFSPEDGSALVGTFSGGWKMRIGLAKILLLDPNILLLDEPTNHMDLDSVIWLEDFLQRQNIPMLVVSHDREFLDRVCTKIVDVEEGKTVSYSGNYSKYLEQRRARLAQWRDKYEKQQRFIREEEAFIRKAHGDPSLAQVAKSRQNALDKLRASEELISAPPRDRKFRFRFPPAPRCGESIVQVQGLAHGYGEGKYQVLFENVDFQVERGDRIGFIGPNGSGKSTLMRILMGLEDPLQGFAEYGSSSVKANYYAQNQADALDLSLTVLETVQSNAPSEVSVTDIRTLLGQFMFKGDDVYKKVGVLSGGEKARVALCKMMLEPANLLLLDEPTNHLDITSKEVLEEALLNYAGSVVLISHDRYFMSQVANTIFSFHDHTVERFDCDYHDYLEREAAALEELQAAQDQEEQDLQDAADAQAAAQAETQAYEDGVHVVAQDGSERAFADRAKVLQTGPYRSPYGEQAVSSRGLQREFDLLSEKVPPGDLAWVGDIATPHTAGLSRVLGGARCSIQPDAATGSAEDSLPPLPKLPIDLTEISIPRGSKDAKISVTVSSSRQDARGKVSLKEKVTARYVSGDKYKITHAKEVLVEIGEEDRKNKKKNFGGSGVTCGNLNKGIKNAKRFKNNI